jgi:glycosyltransferase involved in cell wall biosynthesis
VRQVTLYPRAIFQSIVVVDDGSENAHQEVFEAIASLPGVVVVRRDVNRGQGAALKSGIAHAIEHNRDLLGVVTADADGQHAPRDIVRVAEAFTKRPDAVILGVRTFGANVPFRSRVGNIATQHLVAWLTPLKVTDTQTGLRGWPRRSCERNLRSPANGFEFNLATLLDASAAGEPIVEIPIETIYEPRNPSSHFRPLRDSMRIYRVLARYAWRGFLRRHSIGHAGAGAR